MKQLPAPLDANLAIRAYKADPDWMFKTGIGGVVNGACLIVATIDPRNLLYVPVALALNGIVTGYLLRTAKTRVQKPDSRLPEWNEWVDLFTGGLTWVALQFGLGIVAAIPITTIMIACVYGIMSAGATSSAIAVGIGVIGTTIILSFLLWHFLLGYLMINFAAEEKLLGAFALRKLFRYSRRAPVQLTTAWILAFELQALAVILPAVTLVGVFIIPLTLFIAQVVGISLMAQAWHAVVENEKYVIEKRPL